MKSHLFTLLNYSSGGSSSAIQTFFLSLGEEKLLERSFHRRSDWPNKLYCHYSSSPDADLETDYRASIFVNSRQVTTSPFLQGILWLYHFNKILESEWSLNFYDNNNKHRTPPSASSRWWRLELLTLAPTNEWPVWVVTTLRQMWRGKRHSAVRVRTISP